MFDSSTLVLAFVLGLRHGLDPDHVAVIDGAVFRTAAALPRRARWTGFLFALGHSLSVAAVAIGVALFARHLDLPGWWERVTGWMVALLLLLVGGLNLRALRRSAPYRPAGWRGRLLPRALAGETHPAAVFGVGALFGLVFDTATQAAAWGAAGGAAGGVGGAALVAATFSAGMICVDTADSQVVARLLASSAGIAAAARYRRAVGWVIVVLSFGTAAVALADLMQWKPALTDGSLTAGGALAAATVLLLLWRPWHGARVRCQDRST